MLYPNRYRVVGFVFAATLVSRYADAQSAVQSFAELERTLKVRQTVVVTDETGQALKGKVDKLSSDSITVDGHTFIDAAVREIRLSDPLWNGMLVGAAVGTGLATWDYLIDPSEPGNGAIFSIAIGLGAAIGAGIDALRTGRLLYASPRQKPEIQAQPVISKRQQGVLVRILF
jgi:hypothetical protein